MATRGFWMRKRCLNQGKGRKSIDVSYTELKRDCAVVNRCGGSQTGRQGRRYVLEGGRSKNEARRSLRERQSIEIVEIKAVALMRNRTVENKRSGARTDRKECL